MTGLTNLPPQADDVDTHAAAHYAGGADPIDLAKLGAIPALEKGKAGGVATLGEDGKVPHGQLGNVSRSNLLRNWYLADPVDQPCGYVVPPGARYRTDNGAGSIIAGVTEKYYKAEYIDIYGNAHILVDGVNHWVDHFETPLVRGYVGADYVINGWYISQNMVLIIEDEELVLKNVGTSFGVMHQFTCDNNRLGGRLCTCSALVNEQLLSFTGKVAKAPSSDTYVGVSEKIDAGYIEYWSRADKREVLHFIVNAGAEMRIKAAKLEFGDTQTIAHQDENGNWVLNDPSPDKTTELLKCIQSTADPYDPWANKIVLHTGNVTAGTTDLEAGSSALAHGAIYQVYE